jgi:two-component system response regulator NreC
MSAVCGVYEAGRSGDNHICRAPLEKIRVLIVDDHDAVLDTVSRMLSLDFDVVGTAGDAEELLREAERLQPDVLISDISLPEMSGIEAVRILKKTNPTINVLFLTVHENVDYVHESFAAGGLGYVVKSRIASDLFDAIKAVQSGHSFVSPSIMR